MIPGDYEQSLMVVQGKVLLPHEMPIATVDNKNVQLSGFTCEPRVEALTTQKIKLKAPEEVPTLNTVVLEMMKNINFLPGASLGNN